MTALRLFPPALAFLSLIFWAMPSPAASYVLDDFSDVPPPPTLSLSATQNVTETDTRLATGTDAALDYSPSGLMRVTLDADQGNFTRTATVSGGQFSFSILDRNILAQQDTVTLFYGSAVTGESFIVPTDAAVLRLDDIAIGTSPYLLWIELFNVGGASLGISPTYTITSNRDFLFVLLSEIADPDLVRGLSITFAAPSETNNANVIGSISGVLLVPEPGRAALTAMGLMLLLLRRRR